MYFWPIYRTLYRTEVRRPRYIYRISFLPVRLSHIMSRNLGNNKQETAIRTSPLFLR